MQLSDVVDLQVGYAFKSAWYSAEGPRLVRGANVAPGKMDWEDEKRLTPELVPEYVEYLLAAGDIVLAMDRPIISGGLKVAVLGPEDDGALLVQRVARFRANNFARQDFIWFLLNSPIFIDHALEHATGSDLPHISSNDIQTTAFELPSLAEQDEIISRLRAAFSWIDRIVHEHDGASRLIERLDQSILAKAFRGELVPQAPDDEPASVLLERIQFERAAQPKKARKRKARS